MLSFTPDQILEQEHILDGELIDDLIEYGSRSKEFLKNWVTIEANENVEEAVYRDQLKREQFTG